MAAPPPPRSSNYRRGANFERIVAAALERDGYVVMRAAGSHGKADLVALKPTQVVLVQCKLTGTSAVRPPEWNALWDAATRAGAIAVIASRPARGRIGYAQLTGPKTRPSRRAPAQAWTPDQLNEGS